MKKNNISNSKTLMIIVACLYVLGMLYHFTAENEMERYDFNFRQYAYSFDAENWVVISENELKNTVFQPDESLYIQAFSEVDYYEGKQDYLSVVIEINSADILITMGNEIVAEYLIDDEESENSFIVGNDCRIAINSVRNSPYLYTKGLTFKLTPNPGQKDIEITTLSIFDDSTYVNTLAAISFEKVLIGVMLIAIGVVFLLTRTSNIINEAFEFKYYVVGATSLLSGIVVLFLSNYDFALQNKHSEFWLKISYISLYFILLNYASILYDEVYSKVPKWRTNLFIIPTVSTTISLVLIANLFLQFMSNRVANYIFIVSCATILLITIIIVVRHHISEYIYKRKTNFGEIILESIFLSAYMFLLINIAMLLYYKVSIMVPLRFIKIFLMFNILWLILYVYEAQLLARMSATIKDRTNKVAALTNIRLDVNKMLIDIDRSDVASALESITDITNMYMPEIVFWEILILELDKKAEDRLSQKQKIQMENALEFTLICSDLILTGDVLKVNADTDLVYVGTTEIRKDLIGKKINKRAERFYSKLRGEIPLGDHEMVVRSTIPQFKDVYFIVRGLESFSIEHRKLVEKNMRMIFENVENILIQNELRRNQKQIIYNLTTISESKSKETFNHVNRVVSYTRILCDALGFPEEEAEMVSIASAMHDIGKITTPFEVLHKNGKLTFDEFEKIKLHTEDGFEILKVNQGELFRTAAVIARDHHERYNGKGYRGAKGEEIHIYARIVAIADVFDALASDRAYKKAWSLDKVLNLILSESGEHFDPVVVDAFFDNFNEFLEIKRKYAD